jgi:hypothetical protein
MAKWSVYGRVIGSKYLGTYEADSKEEAEDKAMEAKGSVSLCHHCSSECEDPEVDNVIAKRER